MLKLTVYVCPLVSIYQMHTLSSPIIQAPPQTPTPPYMVG